MGPEGAVDPVAPVLEPLQDGDDYVLRVSASSNASNLASAISHAVYESKKVVLRAVGAGAVNQALKACAISRGYVAPKGIDLTVRPGFTTVEMPEGPVTAMVLAVIVTT